jgi:hypothetical protein
MATPFGGHPTFGQYIASALGKGCSVDFGYAQTPDGHMERITRIVTADGSRWVIEVGTAQSDYLVPTTIARLDRRLGIQSPWFSIDDSGYTPTA